MFGSTRISAMSSTDWWVLPSPKSERPADEPPVDVSWDALWAAFRCGNDIYLYVNPGRALILPDGQASVKAEALRSYIQAHLGAEKCFAGRKNAG